MQEYVDFIRQQINYFKHHAKLIEGNEITPYMINTVLANYTLVGLALIGEYSRYKDVKRVAEKEYDKWYSHIFKAIRSEMIAEVESKTIKIAVKEIENEVKARYEQKYWDYKDVIDDSTNKMSFIKMLIDQWNKLDLILNNLSKNMRQEMVSLSIEDRLNKDFNQSEQVSDSTPSRKVKRTPV